MCLIVDLIFSLFIFEGCSDGIFRFVSFIPFSHLERKKWASIFVFMSSRDERNVKVCRIGRGRWALSDTLDAAMQVPRNVKKEYNIRRLNRKVSS